MFNILASSFSIKPRENETALQTYGRVQRVLRKQLELFALKYDKNAAVDWDAQAISWNSSESASMMCEDWHDDDRTNLLTTCQIEYSIEQQPWQVIFRFGSTAGTDSVEVSATWSRTVVPGGIYPLARAPRLLDALATEGCVSLDLALPFSLTCLHDYDIQWFCLDVLENPDRCIPLVIVSPTEEENFLINAELLARRLFGLALVFQLEDAIAVQILKEYLGSPLACYDGAIRVYWPNFHLSDRHTLHNYWTAARQRGFSETMLHQSIFQLVAQSSLRYHELPSQLRALEQIAADDRATSARRATSAPSVHVFL